MQTTFNTAQLKETAVQLLAQSKGKKTWAFYAPMGAGKTTLIHTLCKEVLGVGDVISSPTFAIINQYQSGAYKTIYHMDWYRLKDEEEAINAGVEDAIHTGDLCLIEWPEKAEGLLPDDSFIIKIAVVDANNRVLTMD